MEKRVPHYNSASIQAQVACRGADAFTKAAVNGGYAMGLTIPEMLAVIAALSRQNFYESMTTYADYRVWQDVYHAPTPVGKDAYIKVTMRDMSPVIQFKRNKMNRQNCVSCGQQKGMTHFEKEAITIEHAGLSVVVEDLSGWRCEACDEVEFDRESAVRYATAGDRLTVRSHVTNIVKQCHRLQ